ncbi:hypothetical protein [Streptomyces sp. FIT100]|uniref:hypothetical protein n=1 Tax=Streptomyces sp. FIT100 TaxID=2837956 RepID=UPI0021C88314|nr:hypothetical protein [Streptomyces sp. FIT100]UUN28505.1 hypothetical protein KK483_20590 [Streptomyces sp. FIT100]
MPNNRNNRPAARRTGSLTRLSVRRGGRTRSEPTDGPDRLRYLRSPATWLAGILLAVATVTFQDVLTGAVKAILPLDRLPDRLSPQNAIDVVEVRNVKKTGLFLVRGDVDGRVLDAVGSGEPGRHEESVVDVDDARWMVTLQGRASQQVRITDIVPEVEGGTCSSPLTGNLVNAPSQGVQRAIALKVAIDEPAPRLMVPKEKGPEEKGKEKETDAEEPYFTGSEPRHITLDQNESEALLIEATSEEGYCRWRYRVRYQVGGSTAEMVLSRSGGKPFELTGQLADASGYRSVHYRSFGCSDSTAWLTGTGEEYKRAGDTLPCPPS